MGVIDCLCTCFVFVLTFFMIWTIGVRDKKKSAAFNSSIGQRQKTTEGLATPI